METQKSRWFRFALIGLLAGIALELAVLIALIGESENQDGNIAVVELTGTIETSRPTIKELKRHEENPRVKAIILRVDSPGGTVGASQEIYEEVLRISKTKKIVASLGDIAASGGYYAASAADKIVANPGTITGSIGVIAHHFIVEDLLKRFHLRWEVIQAGKMKDLASPLRNLNPEERRLLQELTHDIHEQFIEAVSKGRKLPAEQVRKVADGRIWSGRRAKELRLVDELGGLERAIDVAAQLVGIKKEPEVVYPKEERFGWVRRFLESRWPSSSLSIGYKLSP